MSQGRIVVLWVASQTREEGLVFGGNPKTGATETWNGTSWTEVNNMSSLRDRLGGAGTQTAALGFAGGLPFATGTTESWNGTSWTELNDLNTATKDGTGVGATNTVALAFGGPTATTEEFNAGPLTVTFSDS